MPAYEIILSRDFIFVQELPPMSYREVSVIFMDPYHLGILRQAHPIFLFDYRSFSLYSNLFDLSVFCTGICCSSEIGNKFLIIANVFDNSSLTAFKEDASFNLKKCNNKVVTNYIFFEPITLGDFCIRLPHFITLCSRSICFSPLNQLSHCFVINTLSLFVRLDHG